MNDQAHSPNQDEAIQAELVAYLDRELDSSDVQQVEKRLAADTPYRDRLHQLEATWDLLDQLPRTTAGESFTRSTVEMVAVAAAEESRHGSAATPSGRAARWLLIGGGLLAACLVGYFANSALMNWHDRSLAATDSHDMHAGGAGQADRRQEMALWFSSLSEQEQEEFLDDLAPGRAAPVRHRPNRDFQHLPHEDMRKIFTWLKGYAQRHERELLALLSKREQQQLKQPENSRHRHRKMLFLFLQHHQQLPLPDEEELGRLTEKLSEQTKQRLAEQPDARLKVKLLRDWVRITMSRHRHRRHADHRRGHFPPPGHREDFRRPGPPRHGPMRGRPPHEQGPRRRPGLPH